MFARHAIPVDVRDERSLMGLSAGVLWLVAGVAGAIGTLLPAGPEIDWPAFLAIDALIVALAVSSLAGWLPWEAVPLHVHAWTTAALHLLIAVAIWATGGVDSHLYPLVLFPLLYVAYFFPPRMSIPLIAELVVIYSAPLLYTGDHLHVFPGRLFTFAAAAVVIGYVVWNLKRRLLAAEERQRAMALTDALTGLANRRAFDIALAHGLGDRGDVAVGRRLVDAAEGCALLLIDLDGFKQVNDSRGHAAGDDLLRAVAAHCDAAVRPGDTTARIGGDEFAVVAPAAGQAGAVRLAGALAKAVEDAGAAATIAWAVHPEDGETEDALLRAADHRLYASKPHRSPARPQ